jgi:hypothetical protein
VVHLIIKYSDVFIEVENDEVVEEVNNHVKKLNKEKKVLSHLVVDQQEVYTDFESYIELNKEEINEIEIITLTYEEMTYQILLSINEYLERMLPNLEEIIEENYGELSEVFWSHMTDFGEGMDFIISFVGNLKELNPQIYTMFESNVILLTNGFKELVISFENKDATFSFDILSYEIKPVLEALQNDIKSILKLKVGDNIEH